MFDHDQQYLVNFREEILEPLFKHVKAGESFYVIGGASMGKTRLLDHLLREDVKKHYLKDQADYYWLTRVDMNRLSFKDEPWAFYELLLSTLALEQSNHELGNDLRKEIVDLDSKVIQGRDQLLALRFFEMAVSRLCHVFDIRICFLFDEFDETYKRLGVEMFNQLRAIRDANKYRVTYGVFLRNLPERLRTSQDNESFYELISRNMLCLGPYSRADAQQIIRQLETRRDCTLTQTQRDKLVDASGGHVGLMQAFLSILIENDEATERISMPDWIEWFSQQPFSVEECRKIWEGLVPDERNGLLMFVQGDEDQIPTAIARLLTSKRLIHSADGPQSFFSPVFERYIRNQS